MDRITLKEANSSTEPFQALLDDKLWLPDKDMQILKQKLNPQT